MKKLTTILLALALCLSLVSPIAALAEEPLRVAIVQLAENGAFADMRNGFIDRTAHLCGFGIGGGGIVKIDRHELPRSGSIILTGTPSLSSSV